MNATAACPRLPSSTISTEFRPAFMLTSAFCAATPFAGNPHRGNLQTHVGRKIISFEESKFCGSGAAAGRVRTTFCEGEVRRASTWKGGASTDHKPGPNMARAPPMVPSKSGIHGSPARVKIWQIASKATSVPAIGVHSPGMSRTPDPIRNAELIVALMGGLLPQRRACLARPMPSRQPGA